MTKAFIVFSGYNQRAVIAFMRTLVKHNIPFGIIATGKDDTIFLTDYSTKVLSVRDSPELEINGILGHIRKLKAAVPADSYVIAPSTEALNRFLIDNVESLKTEDCEVPLVVKMLYEEISDKNSFGELCRQNGITVPNEYEDFQAARIPFVAKPRTYFASGGGVHTPVIIRAEDDKSDFKNQYDLSDFYYQEYVSGNSYYLLYYFYKDGNCDKLSQKNLIQQPQGKSILAAVTSDVHWTEISERYEELFAGAGFRGLVMIEVKQSGGRFYMIEANPRFWGPSQLFVDSGPNLFESLLNDHGFDVPTGRDKAGTVRYFWYGGLWEAERSGGEITYYDYSRQEYETEKQDWLSADVYNRDDTIKLFESEAG